MEIGEKLDVKTSKEWRNWLLQHHLEKTEIWLVLFKKSAPEPKITLEQAQEEALCFGWVDSMSKSIDATSYALRFSPRRKNSHWTDGNKSLALRLLEEGRMAPSGIAALPPDVIQAWEWKSKQ